MLDTLPGETIPEPPSHDQYTDAQNNDDIQSITDFGLSTDDRGPSDTDLTSDEDRALQDPLLFDRASNNRR